MTVAQDKDQTVDSNDQVVRTLPNTDLGGHDTSGTHGEERTERPGSILGTPNPDEASVSRTQDARAIELARADYVTAEVDRANREELPRLGGNSDIGWQATDAKGKPVKTASPKADEPK
jgi:hypothetical protein